MKRNIYLICTIIGFIIPWSILLFNITPHEPVTELFGVLFANNFSASFTADLAVSIIVFWIFVLYEAQNLKMKNAGLYMLAAAALGLSFALPLFLYFRERQLERR